LSTEATKTAAFLRLLRHLAPDGVVTKYNDRLTSAIPDASLTRRGRTVWMEFKAYPPGYPGTLMDLLAHTNRHWKVQLHRLWQYHVASDRRAFLVLFEPNRTVSLYRVVDPHPNDLTWITAGPPLAMSQWLLALCR
jgi:hypothetical protein